MDSGNSGSLQSSSGGDGEDDSSPLSALLRQPLAAPTSSALPAGLFGGGTFYQEDHHLAALSPAPHLSSSSAAPLPAAVSPSNVPARGSRKRTRASRRAPTTVLTTDASNFRAMVQEFTGVPAPPFAASTPGARSRFDHLFHSRPAVGALSPYLLRPFAHKLVQHQQQAAPAYHPQPSIVAAPPSAKEAGASGDGYRLAAADGVLEMQDHRNGGNYLLFQSSSRFPVFDAAGFSEGSSHGGDELSGLVGAADGSETHSGPASSNAQTATPVAAGAIRAPGAVLDL